MTFIFICLLLPVRYCCCWFCCPRLSLSRSLVSMVLAFNFELKWMCFVIVRWICSSLAQCRDQRGSSSLAMFLLCFARIDSCLCHTRHFFFKCCSHSLSFSSFLFPNNGQNDDDVDGDDDGDEQQQHFLLNEQVSIYLVSLLYCFILQIRTYTFSTISSKFKLMPFSNV